MNLKIIRKNYDALSLRERYSLFERALDRDDKSEIQAIVSASPKTLFQLTDFYFFKETVRLLQIANLLERLKYQEMFDLFFEHREEIADADIEKFETTVDNILLCGYLYRIETDAWQAVGDEFGFDVQDFRQMMSKDFMTFGILEIKDKTMRELSFTDEGAKIAVERKNLNSVGLKTLETQTAKYRQILLEAEK
jgi:hypothetical protein